MKSGANYDCPVVLIGEDNTSSSPLSENKNKRKRQNIVCIDVDSSDDDDQKIAAQPPKRARATPLQPMNRGPQTLCRRPWTVASSFDSDSDDDDNVLARQRELQQAEWQRRARQAAAKQSPASSSVARMPDPIDSEDDEDEDTALAQQLQQQEWGRGRRRTRPANQSPTDASLQALLKAEQELGSHDKELNRLVIASDASLAAQLQKQEQSEKDRRVKDEQAAMSQSLDGRAWLFVNQVLELHRRLSPSAPGPTTVSVDDMVFLGKNFLQCMQDFESTATPCRVTLAYHYTSSRAMDKIKQDGLMTLAERRQTYSSSTSHGAVFGDGVYTCLNPFAFRHFGDTGLLVAVILGRTARAPYAGNPRQTLGNNINTVIGNKTLRNLNGNVSEETKYFDELVLQESRQCLPLMRFDTASVSSQAGKDAVWAFHQELQRLLDKVFNKGTRTQLKRIDESSNDPFATASRTAAASSSAAAIAASSAAAMAAINAAMAGLPVQPRQARPFGGVVPPGGGVALPGGFSFGVPAGVAMPSGMAPGSLRRPTTGGRSASKPEVLTYTAPQTLTTSTPADAFVACNKSGSTEDCVICMESLSSGRVVRLKDCKHEYHRKCIKDALKAQPWCPMCRTMIRKPQGVCPSGTMSITTSSIQCSGFGGRSIVITYSIPSGTQMPYHENPGQRYQGATRVAYLPDNDDGRKLLKRLKYAWMHGLTFRVGTSLTTHQQNCVTWASIHHKTSPSGGTHGFPDAGFFINCNSELDAAGVPKEG